MYFNFILCLLSHLSAWIFAQVNYNIFFLWLYVHFVLSFSSSHRVWVYNLLAFVCMFPSLLFLSLHTLFRLFVLRTTEKYAVIKKSDSIEHFFCVCVCVCAFVGFFFCENVKVMVFDAARRKILPNNHKFEDKKLNIKIEICENREKESLCAQRIRLGWNWWQEKWVRVTKEKQLEQQLEKS